MSEQCPMGFDCESMADFVDCIFGGPPYCQNITFCREQTNPRPLQPRYFTELWEQNITDCYDPIEDDSGSDWQNWERIEHFQAVWFGTDYNASEIEDLKLAGYAEAVEIRWPLP